MADLTTYRPTNPPLPGGFDYPAKILAFINALGAGSDPFSRPDHVQNLSLTFAVGSNALTANVKARDGTAPSADNPVAVAVKSALAAGDYNVRTITGALSLTIVSGATVGHTSAVAGDLYWYIVEKDANTRKLAVAGSFLGHQGVGSTTLMDANSDSAAVLYADEALASKPYRCIARTIDTQTTAGTWTATPAECHLPPFVAPAGEIGGSVAYSGVLAPAQITANQNDYNPSGLSSAGVLLVSTDAARNITSVAGGARGRVLQWINTGTFALTFTPDDGASGTAANRFSLDGRVTIYGGQSASFIYDASASRWRLLHQSRTRLVSVTGKNITASRPSASTIDVNADELVLTDAQGNTRIATTIDLTLDITASGENGLDAGSEASNTWYYAHVLEKPDGTRCGVLSTSATAPTLPTGYTFWALVSAVRNDGSSNFVNYVQRGARIYFAAGQSILSGGTATSETNASTAAAVPAAAYSFDLSWEAAAAATSGPVFGQLRHVSGANFQSFRISTASGSGETNYGTGSVQFPYVGNVAYLWDSAFTSRSLSLFVTGFTLPIGGA
ncbi:MAG: hypothetical protein IT529_04640 [Burkholderiales bacterium]|nr:hypothetical protein [Burkholderiales bacterium]